MSELQLKLANRRSKLDSSETADSIEEMIQKNKIKNGHLSPVRQEQTLQKAYSYQLSPPPVKVAESPLNRSQSFHDSPSSSPSWKVSKEEQAARDRAALIQRGLHVEPMERRPSYDFSRPSDTNSNDNGIHSSPSSHSRGSITVPERVLDNGNSVMEVGDDDLDDELMIADLQENLARRLSKRDSSDSVDRQDGHGLSNGGQDGHLVGVDGLDNIVDKYTDDVHYEHSDSDNDEDEHHQLSQEEEEEEKNEEKAEIEKSELDDSPPDRNNRADSKNPALLEQWQSEDLTSEPQNNLSQQQEHVSTRKPSTNTTAGSTHPISPHPSGTLHGSTEVHEEKMGNEELGGKEHGQEDDDGTAEVAADIQQSLQLLSAEIKCLQENNAQLLRDHTSCATRHNPETHIDITIAISKSSDDGSGAACSSGNVDEGAEAVSFEVTVEVRHSRSPSAAVPSTVVIHKTYADFRRFRACLGLSTEDVDQKFPPLLAPSSEVDASQQEQRRRQLQDYLQHVCHLPDCMGRNHVYSAVAQFLEIDI